MPTGTLEFSAIVVRGELQPDFVAELASAKTVSLKIGTQVLNIRPEDLVKLKRLVAIVDAKSVEASLPAGSRANFSVVETADGVIAAKFSFIVQATNVVDQETVELDVGMQYEVQSERRQSGMGVSITPRGPTLIKVDDTVVLRRGSIASQSSKGQLMEDELTGQKTLLVRFSVFNLPPLRQNGKRLVGRIGRYEFEMPVEFEPAAESFVRLLPVKRP